MQDKITIADAPECLNTNDKAMWVLGYEAAIEARGQCLHQIQEPAAAEQAAWHAGLDEGRAQAAPAAVAVPDGWKLVPVVPTAAMLESAVEVDKDGYPATYQTLYMTMVGAALAATPAADAPVNVWQQAIDKELVSSHLGVAGDTATADDAKWALHQLICWNIDVATNPATNGGKVLAAAAAPVVLPEPVMNEDGYLPCPFCGSDQVSKSIGKSGDGTPWPYVECESCAAMTEVGQWNWRALLAGVSAPAASEANTLRDLLNRRPAVNAGLVEEYTYWNSECYRVIGANAATPANDAAPQAQADARDAGNEWQEISTMPTCDDLIWLYCQETNTTDGPIAPDPSLEQFGWTHWAYANAPSTAVIDRAAIAAAKGE